MGIPPQKSRLTLRLLGYGVHIRDERWLECGSFLYLFYTSFSSHVIYVERLKKKSCTKYKCHGLVSVQRVLMSPAGRWMDTFNERCYLLALLRRQFPDSVQGGQSSVIFYVDINS